MKIIKVTFLSKPYKQGRKMIQSEIVEFYKVVEGAKLPDIKLRALALGWTLLKVEEQ